MSSLSLRGKVEVLGCEVPNIEGGFGEGKKSMLAKDVAHFHQKSIREVNQNIKRNGKRFKIGVDILDVKNEKDFAITLSDNGILSQNSINASKNIFLLSERGYAKLIKIFDDDLSWEMYDKLLDEYFEMREEQNSVGQKFKIPATYAEALRELASTVEENEKKDQIIGELKPKADYTDTILQNKELVTITQIAKDYGMSGQAMNKLLHELGVQYKQSGQWLLYSEHHGKGYTHSETFSFEKKDGTKGVVMNTKWTQKGRLFLYDLLKENGHLPTIEMEFEQLN